MTSSTTTADVTTTRAGSSRTAPDTINVTARQRQILMLFIAGRTRPQIATELGVMPGTVGDYIKDLYLRLDVHNPQDAVAAAREAGLIPQARAER